MSTDIFLNAVNRIVGEEGLITQERLADETGLSQSTISDYVNKKTKPRIANRKRVLKAIGKILNKTEDEIKKYGTDQGVRKWWDGSFDDPKVELHGGQIATEKGFEKFLGRESNEDLERLKENAARQIRQQKDSQIDCVEIKDPIVWEHLKIIQQFKNKSLACSVNKKLVELESLDDTALAEIVVEINNKIKELKQQAADHRPTGTNPGG